MNGVDPIFCVRVFGKDRRAALYAGLPNHAIGTLTHYTRTIENALDTTGAAIVRIVERVDTGITARLQRRNAHELALSIDTELAGAASGVAVAAVVAIPFGVHAAVAATGRSRAAASELTFPCNADLAGVAVVVTLTAVAPIRFDIHTTIPTERGRHASAAS